MYENESAKNKIFNDSFLWVNDELEEICSPSFPHSLVLLTPMTYAAPGLYLSEPSQKQTPTSRGCTVFLLLPLELPSKLFYLQEHFTLLGSPAACINKQIQFFTETTGRRVQGVKTLFLPVCGNATPCQFWFLITTSLHMTFIYNSRNWLDFSFFCLLVSQI